MSTGILITNSISAVTYTYTAPCDCKLLIAYGTNTVGANLIINGVTFFLFLSGTTGAIGTGLLTFYVGAGQTFTVTWPGNNAPAATVSVLEEY